MTKILHLTALVALSAAALFLQAPCSAQDMTITVDKELCDDSVSGETPDVSSGSFTAAARVKLIEPGNEVGNGDNLGMILSVGSGWTEGFRVYFDWRTNRFAFQIGKEGGANGCSSAAPLPPGVIRDVVAVCDGEAKTLSLYVDGELAASAPHVSEIVTNGAPLKVGYVGMGVGSNLMYVDTVDYWARALTQEEIEKRNSDRALKELAMVKAMNQLGSVFTNANANAANVDDAPNLTEALELDIPESAKEQIREQQRNRAFFLGNYAETAPQIFDDAQKFIDAAAANKAETDKEVTNERLNLYGNILDKLQTLESQSRTHAEKAKQLAWSIKLAYPKETAVFSKIGQLENSAERVRKIEKDALTMRQRVGARLKAATNKRVIYVAPDGNDVAGTGARNAPFASLARALESVQQDQARRVVTVVEMRDGVYQVDQTAKLTGAQNVLVRSAPGAKVVLTGGRTLANFAPLADAARASKIVADASERFDESVRKKIFVSHLRQAGVSDFGQMRNRGYGLADKVACVPSLYLGGESQTLARWPNDGEEALKFGKKVDKPEDGSTSTFTYDYDKPDSWQDLSDVWAFGLFEWEWAANLRKVKSINRDNKQITFDYANGSGRFDYYFVNVLEEVDAPGEYFIDKANGVLYFYPPEDVATVAALNKANVEFDEFSGLFVELDACQDVVFQGVSFKLTRESFGQFTNCHRCYVDECDVEQIGGNVLIINGGSFCGMLNSRMREIGACGVRIYGGDRASLTPCCHLMHNNFVSDFSRIDRVYAPAVHVKGCGVAVTNNLMCDSPHHAMRTDGNDLYIARNEVHSCVYEYSDQSGVDIYCDPSYRGIVIEKNLWRHIGSAFALCGQAGIRLDDSISGVVMLDNVFYRSSGGFFGGIQIHGGKDNLCKGNLMVDCKQAFSFSPWGEGRYEKFVKEQFPENVGNDVYLKTYPFFDEIFDHPNRNYILNNKAVNCGLFNQNGNGLNVFVGNVAQSATPNLFDFGITQKYEQYGDAFYTNPRAMRLWLEQLRGEPLSEIGLKGKWIGANIDVSPKFKAIE